MKKRPNLLAGEDLPPRPRQRRSVDKRARLEEAALNRFGKKGFEATSVEDIADRANLAVGTLYQHFRTKRQLLLALMDDLVEQLSQLDLKPQQTTDARTALHDLLSRAFSHELKYLGAYRAWREAVLSDAGLARKDEEIHEWTTSRVRAVFDFLHRLPGARPGVDVAALARVMDGFFWTLLAKAAQAPKSELNEWIDSATHLVYHAIVSDSEPARPRSR